MTTAGSSPEEPPRLLGQLLGWYAVRSLVLGRRAGLLDTLLTAPGTAEEIAGRAGVDARNALEWLRTMVAAGHAEHRDGMFSATAELIADFGETAEMDLRAILDVAAASADLDDDVVAAMRAGRGVNPSRYAGLSEAGGRINTPLYRAALVSWLSAVPGLADRLRAGARVAELASGGGDAAVVLGSAFPATEVVAFDIVAPARPDAPDNVRLRQGDARALPEDGPFDLVYALDSFHHFGAARPVLDEVRRVLAPGGALVLAESALSGDLDTDRSDPFAVVAYTAGLFYCLQENLAAGGDGRTGGDGVDWIVAELEVAGFTDVATLPTAAGYTLVWATAP